MKRDIVSCKTPFRDVQSVGRSAFLVPDDNDLTAAFSLRGIFKKKDTGSSDASQTNSTTEKKGSGIGSGILTGLLGITSVAGALAPVLPQLGIGSKSRIAETNAIAAANASVYNAQTQMILAEQEKEKDKEKLYLIVGVGVLLIVVVIAVLFTGKSR